MQKIAVSVIPAANAQPEYAEKLRNWKKDDLKHFNSEVFGQILREVRHYVLVACDFLPFSLIREADLDHLCRSTTLWDFPKLRIPPSVK